MHVQGSIRVNCRVHKITVHGDRTYEGLTGARGVGVKRGPAIEVWSGD